MVVLGETLRHTDSGIHCGQKEILTGAMTLYCPGSCRPSTYSSGRQLYLKMTANS